MALGVFGTLLVTACAPTTSALPSAGLPTHFVLEALPAATRAATPGSVGSLPNRNSEAGGTAETLPLPPLPQAPAGGGTGGNTSGNSLALLAPEPDLDAGDQNHPPPPTPTPPPQPPGCGRTCPDGARAGTVVDTEAPFDPLAGVVVTAGATMVVSDANGRFDLPPPSTSAEVVSLARTRHTTSVVAGWYTGPLTCHLAPDVGAVSTDSTTGGPLFFTVTGRVVAADNPGVGVANVQLAAGAPGGVFALQTVTDGQGRFSLDVHGASAAGVTGATVWAFESGAAGRVARLGAITDAPLDDGQDLGDIPLVPAAAPVTLTADLASPFPADCRWEVTAQGPGGVTLTLGQFREDEHQALIFPLAGVSYALHASAVAYDGQGQSHFQVPVTPGKQVSPTFMFPPKPTGPVVLAPGALWTWWPEPSVDGYRVMITGTGPRWEAFTPLPRLALPAGLPTGPARVRIIAAMEGGLHVASVRALRLFAQPDRYAFWEGPL
ncbi:MAG: hypothetical protein JWM80_5250 [Cyanobacteria bacterium RYN_339]|nr:hypothetical protein [Cyanobacteria bacterium RYN_339]